LYSAYTRRQIARGTAKKQGSYVALQQRRRVTTAVAIKLLAVLLTAALGYAAGRSRLLTCAAAGPVGTNALLFAQRYQALEAEATAAIVASTFAFVATAGLCLALLAALTRPS
jgi:hypothetical protein